MKRDSKVIPPDVYKTWTLFVWQECCLCKKEFRREYGWRKLCGPYSPSGNWGFWRYSCMECCPTAFDANKKIGRPSAPRPPSYTPRTQMKTTEPKRWNVEWIGDTKSYKLTAHKEGRFVSYDEEYMPLQEQLNSTRKALKEINEQLKRDEVLNND